MSDPDRLPDPSPLLSRLPRGSAVIVRHPQPASRALLARRLLPSCRRLRLRLLIAGDAGMAQRLGADGVHWPERMAHLVAGKRTGRRPGWLITAAAHSPSAMRRAVRRGADALLLSPVFATASHPGATALGVLRFARWVGQAGRPVYALGGIAPHTARRLAGSGAIGAAGIGAITAAEVLRQVRRWRSRRRQ